MLTKPEKERVQLLSGQGILGLHPNELLAPLGVLIELTRRCNLRCVHCFANAGEACQSELSLQQWKAVIDELVRLKVPVLFLSGGEPLLYEGFYSLAAYAAARELYVCLLTNMTLIDDDGAARLKEIGISRVEGNLDGPNPNVYDRFRGVRGCFDDTLRGIRACTRACLPVRLNMTVTRLNQHCLAEVAELAVQLGVDDLAYLALISAGRGETNASSISLPEGEYEQEILPQLKEISARFEGQLSILYGGDTEFMKSCDPTGIMPSCGSGRIHCTVTPTGQVKPDVYFPDDDPDIIAGNVTRQSLGDIWRTSRVFESTRRLPPGLCQTCPITSCAGGNLYRSYQWYGTLMAGPEPNCAHSKLVSLAGNERVPVHGN